MAAFHLSLYSSFPTFAVQFLIPVRSQMSFLLHGLFTW